MLPMLAVAALSLVAIGLINARLATRQTRERIESQLQGVLQVLANSNFPLTDAVLDKMGELANADFVLTDRDGKVLAASGLDGIERIAGPGRPADQIDDLGLGSDFSHAGRRYFHSSLQIERRPIISAPSVLHVLFPREEFDEAWRRAFLPPLLVGVGTILAIALVTHLIARRIGKNIAALGSEVQRLADGDYSEVTRRDWDDELRDLSYSINQTATQLAAYEDRVRRTERLRTLGVLGAAMAHEMRNAATGCRMAVDLHAESCPHEVSDECLDVARQQLQIMEQRLQRFLQLGRGEERRRDRLLDFTVLISETVTLVGPSARHAGVDISWREPNQPVMICADSELLTQAVMNLLLNAVEAAAKNGALVHTQSVEVALISRSDRIELTVTDSGAGPEPAIGHDVFKPFATDKAEGAGLGLTIVKKVVEAYEGQISWNRDHDKTVFQLTLPTQNGSIHHV